MAVLEVAAYLLIYAGAAFCLIGLVAGALEGGKKVVAGLHRLVDALELEGISLHRVQPKDPEDRGAKGPG